MEKDVPYSDKYLKKGASDEHEHEHKNENEQTQLDKIFIVYFCRGSFKRNTVFIQLQHEFYIQPDGYNKTHRYRVNPLSLVPCYRRTTQCLDAYQRWINSIGKSIGFYFSNKR